MLPLHQFSCKRPRSRFGLVVAVAAAIVPLVLGTAIYIAFRSPNLRLFQWIRGAGLGTVIDSTRAIAAGWNLAVPAWCVYSLPDGLWLLSLLAAVGLIWQPHPAVATLLGLTLAASAVLFEVAQAMWPRLGTFSWSDLACYGAATAWILLNRRRSPASEVRI